MGDRANAPLGGPRLICCGTKYKKRRLKIPNYDYDLEVQLPNGKTMLLQYRTEGSTLDVCFMNHTVGVALWEDDHLKGAKPEKAQNVFQTVAQACFCLED